MGKDRRYREARSERSCRRRSAPQSATCLIPPVRGDLRHRLALILVTAMVGVYLYAAEPSPATTALGADNPIVVENQFPGSNAWLPGSSIADDAAGQIKGYDSATSVDKCEAITCSSRSARPRPTRSTSTGSATTPAPVAGFVCRPARSTASRRPRAVRTRPRASSSATGRRATR